MDEQKAAEMYDDAASHYLTNPKLNFEGRKPLPFKKRAPRKKHSKHIGISFDKTSTSKPWAARFQIKGVCWQKRFDTEDEALQALIKEKSLYNL